MKIGEVCAGLIGLFIGLGTAIVYTILSGIIGK